MKFERKMKLIDIILGFLLLALLIILLNGCVAEAQQPIKASWHSKASLIKEGTWKNGKERRMANGERFDDNKFTCASRLHNLGAYLQITNLRNQKSIIVRVTDRIGKRFAKTRVDLSKRAFSQIADLSQGLVPVQIKEIK